MKKMNIIKVNDEEFQIATLKEDDILQKYPTVFDTSVLGSLPGKVKLHVQPDARSQILPPRRIPFSVQSDVKAELDRLVNLGVIAPVTDPTEWVNQMADVLTPNLSTMCYKENIFNYLHWMTLWLSSLML